MVTPWSGAQADEGEISAHLRALETGRSGEEIRVRLELSWQGRPELHLISAPSIEVPKDGALRAGLSRSRYNGTNTIWSHDAIVTLPNRSGPWTIGPAHVKASSRTGAHTDVIAVPIRTGRPSRSRHLFRQALGNGMVLSLVLFFGLWRYRRLTEEEELERNPLDELLVKAREKANAATEEVASHELLEALLNLRLALKGQGVDNGGLWTPEQIRERIDLIQFGGEEIPTSECLQMLRVMELAAGTSDVLARPKRERRK
jgi:hypothetical protein